jgi:NAD(P)-dependent dehydrogenase (short-subunit alcohol dehydrogenase family)
MTSTPSGPAVVSGAGSGIGREIALELGRRGYPLVLLGRRRGPLETVLAEGGGEGLVVPCDVRDAAAVDDAAATVAERWDAAEVVVPAAGVAHVAPLAATEPERFREVLEVNLTGVFLLLRALLPAMLRRGRGWIFPLLSGAARRGYPGWSAYCASKWGLDGLVAALREEVRGSGVRITALYPGSTDTPIWNGLPGDWPRAAMIAPRDVARLVGQALDLGPTAELTEAHVDPSGGAL